MHPYVLLLRPLAEGTEEQSFNELSLFRQRLSFLSLLPFRFTKPVCSFPGAHVQRGLWESGSGWVCQAHLSILANVILEGLARAAPPQPQPDRHYERALEQLQGHRMAQLALKGLEPKSHEEQLQELGL